MSAPPARRRDLSSWLPTLIGPLDLQGDGEGVTVRRATLNFVGCIVTDNPEEERTDIDPVCTGPAGPAGPAGAAAPGWVTALDLDFKAESNQTLSANTTYTIGGKTWHRRNSAKDAVAMALVNGTGLVIQPTTGTNWANGDYTMPLIDIPLQSLDAAIRFGCAMRITAYISASNHAATADAANFGVSNAAAESAYYMKRGVSGSGEGFTMGVTGASVGDVLTVGGLTLGSSNDIVMSTFVLGEDRIAGYFAAHGTSPVIPDIATFQPIGSCNNPLTKLTYLTLANASLVVGAQRASSGTSYSATFARIRVEYKLL